MEFPDIFINMMNSPAFQVVPFYGGHFALLLESVNKESDSEQGRREVVESAGFFALSQWQGHFLTFSGLKPE